MGQIGLEKGWPASWTTQIGLRLQRYRKMTGISAMALSERCSDVGFPIPRSTIANLESGRKEAIPAHEVVVLSKALGVPPLALLYGIDESGEVEYLPGAKESAWRAWNRFADGVSILSSMGDWANSEPQETIREALINYGLISANAQAWARVQDMKLRYEDLNRDNSTLRDELDGEMQQILVDTFGALEFFQEHGLPLPDVPSDWLKALAANDAEVAALVKENEDRA